MEILLRVTALQNSNADATQLTPDFRPSGHFRPILENVFTCDFERHYVRPPVLAPNIVIVACHNSELRHVFDGPKLSYTAGHKPCRQTWILNKALQGHVIIHLRETLGVSAPSHAPPSGQATDEASSPDAGWARAATQSAKSSPVIRSCASHGQTEKETTSGAAQSAASCRLPVVRARAATHFGIAERMRICVT